MQLGILIIMQQWQEMIDIICPKIALSSDKQINHCWRELRFIQDSTRAKEQAKLRLLLISAPQKKMIIVHGAFWFECGGECMSEEEEEEEEEGLLVLVVEFLRKRSVKK